MSANNHHKFERTLVIIKPDGIQRSLIGEIITRYERIGLKLVGIKMMIPTKDMVEKHYTLDPEWKRLVGEKRLKAAPEGHVDGESDAIKIGEHVLAMLTGYITAGPVLAMVWQGAHAVSVVRKVTGGTEPRTSDIGTIRGDFMLDSYEMSETDNRAVRNLVHASGSVKEAEDEIAHWFEPSEMFDYRIVQEQILYERDMGIL
jgi:nucleoside-diphosphate kinase